MAVAEMYARSRHVLTELALDLKPEQVVAPVPACPGWTVRDAYAHLVGVGADVLAGNLEGVATPPWTAKHVADRAQHTLGQILTEWAEVGPKLEDALRAIGDVGTERIVVDQWSHEQDIRGAVGKPGSRDVPRLAFTVDVVVSSFGAGWPEDLPAVEVIGDEARWQLGSSQPSVTLTATNFELGRALMGRRSRAQYLALGWTPSDEAVVGPLVDRLHVFPLPDTDLIE